MTPDALRAAIASARERPRMYGETPMHLAAYLLGMIAGAAPDRAAVNAAWCEAYAAPDPRNMTDAEACDAAEAAVATLWPQGDAAQPAPSTRECPQCGSGGWRDNPSHACSECSTPFRTLAAQPDALDADAARDAMLSAARVVIEGEGLTSPPEVVALSLDEHVGNLYARIARLRAEVDALRADIAARDRVAAEVTAHFAGVADEPSPLGFNAALAAVRNGEHNPDRAQLAALSGEAFAEEFPYASAALHGGVAHRSEVTK